MSSNLGVTDRSFTLTSLFLFDNFRKNSSCPNNKDEKKEIQISSKTRSASKPERGENPSRSSPSLPTHFLSEPKSLQMF
jgi:hypothetical protein